ncbi:unnamed protein product [Phytophthora fragariaefolia]|uniref:Unnamed protein product n=1 Tax=Phytophthora fragariaefolia TaxID=1490495 RepID=A0A9W7CZP6_9STRA|nr:unnamed protein product [Phytophthora fragariaefolia]
MFASKSHANKVHGVSPLYQRFGTSRSLTFLPIRLPDEPTSMGTLSLIFDLRLTLHRSCGESCSYSLPLMSSVIQDRSQKSSLQEYLLSRRPIDSADDISNTRRLAKLSNSLLYGVVNSIRAIPTMYGYAVIIFSHPTFGAFMPALSKLVIFSSAVHQLMFTLLSSLPFAIGQVQDAGLREVATDLDRVKSLYAVPHEKLIE